MTTKTTAALTHRNVTAMRARVQRALAEADALASAAEDDGRKAESALLADALGHLSRARRAVDDALDAMTARATRDREAWL